MAGAMRYKIIDPTKEWAEACAKNYNENNSRIIDDVIIKLLGQ
jgi:hypothetical protein